MQEGTYGHRRLERNCVHSFAQFACVHERVLSQSLHPCPRICHD